MEKKRWESEAKEKVFTGGASHPATELQIYLVNG